MKIIKELDILCLDLCLELDSNSISLWSKKQWTNEFNKKGKKIYGFFLFEEIIGICV